MGEERDTINPRSAVGPLAGGTGGSSSADDRDAADDDQKEIDVTDSTDEIREDIQHARAHISETIDAIQDKLNPRRLMDDATETVRAAAVGKVTTMMNNASDSAKGIVDRVKENPVPAALIGVGAWWLFGKKQNGSTAGYAGGSARGSSTGASFAQTVKDHPVPATLAGLGLGWWLLDRQRRAEYGWDQAGRRQSLYPASDASEATQGVTQMARDAKDRVADLTDQVQQGVADFADRAQERAGELADRAQTEFDRLLWDNPLALGAVAVAVGAAIGLVVPETRAEHRAMGDTRDSLISAAQQAADGAVEKVQQVVGGLQKGDVQKKDEKE